MEVRGVGQPEALRSACQAPSGSMYFDQFGKVRACCQNTGTLLGDVTRQSIREIWESTSASRLRDALARDDFSEGCGFCRWQIDSCHVEMVYARTFDRLKIDRARPAWPVQMEFSMSNSCNLQCVMCNGDWSSAIRANREQRPALPKYYGESFFAELADFLPHLSQANFLGGEPFLGREPLRVLEMMADASLGAAVSITTNGTQWSPRVRRICETLRTSICISLDGITRPTYESIRAGASFDEVMGNLENFRRVCANNGGGVSLAHCLMTSNWTEFLDFLTFAEERSLAVGMNVVLNPAAVSLYKLPADELRAVVVGLEAQDAVASGRLDTLLPVWHEQLDALRSRLRTIDAGGQPPVDPWAPWRQTNHGPELGGENAVADGLRSWAGTPETLTFTWDEDGRILSMSSGWTDLLDLGQSGELIGQPADRVVECLTTKYGPNVHVAALASPAGAIVARLSGEAGLVPLEVAFVAGSFDGIPGLLAACRN